MMWKIFFFFFEKLYIRNYINLNRVENVEMATIHWEYSFFFCVCQQLQCTFAVCLFGFFLIFDDLHLPDSFYWNENLIWKNQIGSEYLFVCFLVYEQQQKNGLSFFCSAKIYFEFRKCQFFILFLSFLGSISYDTTTNNNNIFGL